MDRPVTMSDVAERAGVSRASVSRVFLGQNKVSDTTRKRVLKVAADLGYVPNVMASSLASKEHNTIGLLLRDASNPAYGLLFTELQRSAQEQAMNLISMTISIDRSNEGQLNSLRHLLGMQVAGLVVATGSVPSEQLIPFHQKVPIIRAGRPEISAKIHAVSYDEEDAGRQLAAFVVGNGHRRIAVIRTAKETSFPEWIRAEAMITELAHRGITAHIIDVVEGNGHDQLRSKLFDNRITAVMCPSDVRQLDVIRFCQALNLEVPEDVSVTGCDGILPGIDLMGLTSYRIPVEQVAQHAITELKNLLATEKPKAQPIITHRIAGELIPGRTVTRI
ncbi:LacI family DNA-binding transcriptional regulator [Corynebacterium epidermidicanis]|nr:LacI family DNA-binding transcriptional regulator [Corynebacterium epidermidicanis]